MNANDIKPGDSIAVQVSDTLTLTGEFVSLGRYDNLLLIRVAGVLHVIPNYYYFNKSP